MSYLSKCLLLLLNILLLNSQILFSKPNHTPEKVKIGLVLTTSNLNNLDSLSAQLIQTLDRYSSFNIVLMDTNISISIEPFAIDSVFWASLQQDEFHGLILCESLMKDSVQTVIIKALKTSEITPTEISEFEFKLDNYYHNLDRVVQKLVTYFQPGEKSVKDLRVIITLIEISGTDSILINYRQALIDTLVSIFQSPQFSNIQCEVMNHDSSHLSKYMLSRADSTNTRSFQLIDAYLVVSGKIDYNEEQNVVYYPSVAVIAGSETTHQQFEKSNTLYGKTCLLKQFYLHPVTINNLNPATNFVSAYFSIQNKQYTEAIQQLKKFSSLAHNFYLAESYFHRGLSYKHDLASARADWDSCLFYLSKSLSTTESLRDSCCINNNLGVTYQLLGIIDSATVYYSKAYNDLKSNSLTDGFVRASNNLGNIYLLSGRWKKALEIFQSGVDFMEQSGDSLSLATTYENLATIYQLIMQRSKAISYYNKAFEIREAMNDEAGMATIYFHLGDVYQEMNDFEKAEDYYRQDLIINTRLHNEPRLAETYDRLAQVFQKSQVLDSALVYYQKGYDTFELLDDWHGLIRTLVHQASFHQGQKNLEQAISLYEKALQLANDNDSKPDVAKIYDRLGDIYNNQDDLITAYDYYKQAADIYEQLENFETLSLILYNMGLIQLKQNDYTAGYELLKRAVSVDEKYGFNNLSGEKDFLKQLEGVLKNN